MKLMTFVCDVCGRQINPSVDPDGNIYVMMRYYNYCMYMYACIRVYTIFHYI